MTKKNTKIKRSISTESDFNKHKVTLNIYK